jgi:hypothetical protein
MKKALVLVVVIALIGAVTVLAAQPAKGVRSTTAGNSARPPAGADALQWIDYWNNSSAFFYTWTGSFYMSNVFKPQAGWYPLDVVALEVFADSLDGSQVTGAAGVLDGVAVFDPAGNVLWRQLNLNLPVRTWTQVPIATPPRITSGNFFGGMWNDNVAGTPSIVDDGGYQCTAINWSAPPTEPFTCMNNPANTAGGPGAWTANTCGSTYPTVSAASVRAQINSNVPVELMRLGAE